LFDVINATCEGDFVVVTGGSDGVDDSSGGDRGEDWSKWQWKSVKLIRTMTK
jgi:hypothetical protein